MKTKLFLLFLVVLLVCYGAKAQKLYVWKPSVNKLQIRHDLKVDKTIKLIIYDGRAIPKSRIKYSSAELISYLKDFIIKTYPYVRFEILDPDAYYQDILDLNEYTIKIGIYGYFALFRGYFGENREIYKEFVSNTWKAMTAYDVTIYNGKEIKTESIIEKESSLNMWGYKTAKKILSETFANANNRLLNFIDVEFGY